MIPRSVHIIFLLLALTVCSFLPPNVAGLVFARQQAPSGRFTLVEENKYAPELYANNVDFTATLVDLPGARNRKSYWELSYQLFFISEDKYYEAAKRLPRGGSNPTPEQFPGRVLLKERHEKKVHLATLKERTIALSRLPFKSRVPDAQRTKFATLMTSFSVKIFDADLNTTIYHSGIFLTHPYEASPLDPKQAIARRSIYLNFMVTHQGALNLSQLARKIGKTTW